MAVELAGTPQGHGVGEKGKVRVTSRGHKVRTFTNDRKSRRFSAPGQTLGYECNVYREWEDVELSLRRRKRQSRGQFVRICRNKQ